MPAEQILFEEKVSSRASGIAGEGLEEFVENAEKAHSEEQAKAKYKIEVCFSKHRSPNPGAPSPAMVLIWESGKKFHGGGDSRMYWCGHESCGKPMSSDNFAYMHVVCPKCRRELFLDPASMEAHKTDLMNRGLDPRGLSKVPFVVGEKLVNLTPQNLAVLLERVWRELDGDADIYIKYSPHDIRYQKNDSAAAVINTLQNARSHRVPVIYSLKNIIKDLHAGASLQGRFVALLTS